MKVLVPLLPLAKFFQAFHFFFLHQQEPVMLTCVFLQCSAEISECWLGFLSLLIVLILQWSSVSRWKSDASLIL